MQGWLSKKEEKENSFSLTEQQRRRRQRERHQTKGLIKKTIRELKQDDDHAEDNAW